MKVSFLAAMEKTAEYWRNFASHATQARLSGEQFLVQPAGRGVRRKCFFDESAVSLESFTIRMALVRPVSEKPLAHFRQAPHSAPVKETGDIVPIRVITPDTSFVVGMRFHRTHFMDVLAPVVAWVQSLLTSAATYVTPCAP